MNNVQNIKNDDYCEFGHNKNVPGIVIYNTIVVSISRCMYTANELYIYVILLLLVCEIV